MSGEEKKERKLKTYPFNFFLLEKEQDNHLVVLKEARPTFHVVFKFDCPICQQLIDFFKVEHAEDGPSVIITKWDATLHGKRHHEVFHNGIALALESDDFLDDDEKVPKTRSKKPRLTSSSSLTWRLKKEFEARTLSSRQQPLPHQSYFVEYVKSHYDWKSRKLPFWLFFAMGSGKTKSILLALTQHPPPQGQVYIVAPKTVLQYWADTVCDLVLPTATTLRFIIIGYTELMRLCAENENLLRNQVVVLDEVHQYRNFQINMQFVIRCISRAQAVFMLTGTPMINDHLEAEYLFHLMGQGEQYNPEQSTPEDLFAVMKDHVFHYDPKIHDPEMAKSLYPKEEVVIKKVAMSWMQSFEYLRASRSNLEMGGYILSSGSRNSYDSSTRRICNQSQERTDELSPKFELILKDLVGFATTDHDINFPLVIYSPYKELGAVGLHRRVTELLPQLRTGLVSGDTRNRQAIIDRYNAGMIDVFFITNAAHQGCDLKYTKRFLIVNSHMSKYDEDQTKNRVMRYLSHHGIADAKVIVTKYVSTFPTQPPTTAEKQELLRFFQNHWLKGQPCEMDVAATLVKLLKNEITVEEKYEEKMIANHALLVPWVEAIQRASIPYRKLATPLSQPRPKKLTAKAKTGSGLKKTKEIQALKSSLKAIHITHGTGRLQMKQDVEFIDI